MDKVPTFSKKVREEILRRDGYRCQFRTFDPATGKWVRCSRVTGLQVHHVIPRGWASLHLSDEFKENELNSKDNLITLCSDHHIGTNGCGECVHPDTREAQMAYRGGNKQSYFEMMSEREMLNREGIPYWNTMFDWAFQRILRRVNR